MEAILSDNCQIIAAPDVLALEAPERANTVLGWLIAEGVIEQEISDSVLASTGGHRPGRNYGAALEPEVVQMVQSKNYSFLGLLTNGVHCVVGRTVFDAGGNGIELQCNVCASVFKPDDSWSDAVQEWYDENDGASFPCPLCGQPTLLTEWRGPRPWAFANLGVEFWNWPPLSTGFIHALSEKLGHRIIYVRQHL